MRFVSGLLVCAGLVSGQSFEAASVKPSPPPGPNGSGGRQVHGGPGSPDPGSIHYTNMDLLGLVTMAYEVPSYALSGPEWLSSTRFDITAKIPPGATVAQFRVMLQSLLAERFKLAVHRDRKEMQGFELTVAKGGPKLTKSTADSAGIGDGGPQPPASAPQPPRGYTGEISLRLVKSSMEHFASFLGGLLGQPVHDATGLTDAYDIQVRYSLAGLQPGVSPGDDGMPTPLEALQQQLGLKLAPKKETIGRLTIDHIEKAPTEN